MAEEHVLQMANTYEQASAINLSVKAPLVQTLPFSFTLWEVPKFDFATAMESSGYLQGQQAGTPPRPLRSLPYI